MDLSYVIGKTPFRACSYESVSNNAGPQSGVSIITIPQDSFSQTALK